MVEICTISFEKIGHFWQFILTILEYKLRVLLFGDLGNSMRYELQHIKASNSLLAEKIDGVGVDLMEHGNEDIPSMHLLFNRVFDVDHRQLYDLLHAESVDWLGHLFVAFHRFN
jgi:hypothetical protein